MRKIAILFVAALAACGGRKSAAEVPPPVEYGYKVVAVYPHDPTSYTQGLFFHDGHLWESTGLNGKSHLMELDLTTGKALRSAPVESNYFAEGAVALDGKIYQLTWQDGVAMAWDPAAMQVVQRFDIPEGWGLTTDGTNLIMSDGTSRLTVVSPDGFKRLRQFNVRAGRGSVQSLNELEWIDGRIWANVYMTDRIAIIAPATGHVEGLIDLSGLLEKGRASGVSSEGLPTPTGAPDVLNGIARDPETGKIYVTGKLWPYLFEIERIEK